MYLADSFIDTVRGSVSIVRLISEYVSLKKRGKNHLALCPFHTEKTPSFNVNEEKQIFHCFGCSTGGDLFKFVSLIEHLSFPEAVRFVAQRYGIPLPAGAGARPAADDGKSPLLETLAAAGRYYHKILLEEAEGRGGLEYLRRRGVADETIARFELGYAPAGGDRLFRHLRSQGFAPEMIAGAGMARKSDYDSGHYDYFRGRVIFPIRDLGGKVIAFGGRTLGDNGPKYLNSPETLVYNKGRHLFGLHAAKEAFRASHFAILVEGYMDFIVPYQYGIRNVVASLGTGLTEQQVKLLGRYTRNIVVNYDPDTAGMNAAKRSLEIFLSEGFKVNVLLLPEGQDPDTYVQAVGAEVYAAALRNSLPYLEFIAETAFRSERDLQSARGKINVMNAVLPYLAKVGNRVERAAYASKIAQRIGLQDDVLLAEVKKAVEAQRAKIEPERVPTRPEVKPAEAKLLRTLLENAALCHTLWSQVREEDLYGLRTERIFRALLELYRGQEEINYSNLTRHLGEDDLKLLMKVYFQEDAIATTAHEVYSYISAIRRLHLEASIKAIQDRIVQAEREKDEEKMLRCYQEKMEITQQLYTLYQI